LNTDIKIFSIGDSAATIDLGNCITDELNQKILSMHQWLIENSFAGLKDIIIAYSSISVYYDISIVKKEYAGFSTAFAYVQQKLKEAYLNAPGNNIDDQRQIIEIPVCYDDEFGYDLGYICTEKKLSREEVIYLHHSNIYKVYMVGFLPGFAYMGKIDERLMIGRKLIPVSVAAGSVGITGSQTGIYPVNCPGGWQIIGRTPIKLFAPKAAIPIKLRLGDFVQFFPVPRDEFESMAMAK